MGFKGKLLKRFKRRSKFPSDASIDNTTIATKEAVPTTPTGEQLTIINPSPIRLPVLGLDPEGKTADEVKVPLTPKLAIVTVNQVSPDRTNSTQSCSVKSEMETPASNGEKQDVPCMSVEQGDKNILTEITDMAFKLVLNKNNSDLSERSGENVSRGTKDSGSTEENVDLSKVAVAPKVTPAKVELQRTSSAVEYTSAPVSVDVDDVEVSSNAGSARSKTSSSTRESQPSKVITNEKIPSTESKVSPFGRVFTRGVDNTLDNVRDGRSENGLEEDKVCVDTEEVKEANDNNEPEITVEETQLKSSSSWIKAIEKHIVTKTPSDEVSRKGRQVSFDDKSHHIEDDYHYGVYDEDEDSSYDSEADFDDDSQYYDDDDDDDIDGATYNSGDSMMLVENDGGLWGWLCGCDNLNISPGSLEEHNEEEDDDKSVGTAATRDDQRSVISSPCSVDVNVGALVDEGEEMPYNTEEFKPVRTLSSSKMGRKLRVVSPAPRLPSLLKKKETKQESIPEEQPQEKEEPVIKEQSAEIKEFKREKVSKDGPQQKKNLKQEQTINPPRDSQGFPVKVTVKKEKTSKLPTPLKHSILGPRKQTKDASPKQSAPVLPKQQNANKQEQDPPDDATAASAFSRNRPHGAGKELRQLEIYCKSHGGAENLVLRKYPSIPLPAGKNHMLIKVEASTVSSRDCILRLQGDPLQQPSPSVPGFQIVGTIHTLGDGIKSNGEFQVGDRVAALTQGGGNARFISIPASSAILLPPTATNENTVCLVSNYMTAYQALKMAKMKKGGAPLTNSNVLITGGSGPVGQALIDLATREGAIVHTTAHQMHQEHLTKNLKAEWFPVNPSKWLPKLEGRMDVVVDSLCVDGYESSYRALAPDGVLICTGNISAALGKDQSESILESKKLSLWWSDMKAKHVWRNCFFYDIYESFANDPKLFQQELLYLYLQMENGGIKPKVAGRVSLNQVPKAQRLIEKGLPNGTVILNPWKKLDPKQNVPIEKGNNLARVS